MHVHVHVNEELSSVSIKLKVQRSTYVQYSSYSGFNSAKRTASASGCVMTCHTLDNTRKLNRRVWPLSDEDFTVFYSFNYSGGYRGSS